jgi:hypothetical protein
VEQGKDETTHALTATPVIIVSYMNSQA